MSTRNETITYCDTFWGTHGCALQPNHDGPCVCDHREFDENGVLIDGGFEECYGPETAFFSLNDTPLRPWTLRAAQMKGSRK